MSTAVINTTDRENIQISLPTVDIAILKSLAERLGWIITKKTGMDEAIEDIHEGRVYKASSTEDLFKQILG